MEDAFGILSVYDDLELNTVGVRESTLYDIIPVVEQSSGPVVVNATTFTVDCAALPDVVQNAVLADGDSQSESESIFGLVYSFSLAPGSYKASIAPMRACPALLRCTLA